FGGILGVVLVLAFVVGLAILHEQGTKDSYKRVIDMNKQVSDVYQTIMNNRMHLRNFLLNGDSREAAQLTSGMADLNKQIDKTEAFSDSPQKPRDKARALQQPGRGKEKVGAEIFPAPRADKRRKVDPGSATVPEWQIAYLQATPTQEQAKEDEPLGKLR